MDINKFYVFNLLSNIIVKEAIGPFIITIAPVSLCKFDNLSPTNRLHSHKCYELCFIVDGSGEYVHDNTVYEIKKGDVIISNPKSSHEIRLCNKCDSSNSSTLHLIFFNVNIECVEQYYDFHLNTYEEKMIASFLENHKILLSNYDYIFSYINFLLDSTNLKISNYGVYNMIKNIVLESLFELCTNKDIVNFNTNNYSDDFNNLLMYIESNLDRPLTMQDMSEFLFTTESNIHYMNSKYLNLTPKQYINSRKINLAKVYLKMNYKVSDVSSLIGINDISQFSRLFKKYCGISPKSFQNPEVKSHPF